MNKSKLDQFVLDIEFLLISVVQGVALAALASSAISPVANLQFEYLPYIFSAFLFILLFWSGAIIHSLSFIDWPLDLPHNFLYFLASFVEVITFSQITNPLNWFAFVLIFFSVAAILYIVDLNLISKHKTAFDDTEAKRNLYHHIKSEQLYELKILLPVGLLFNLVAFILIYNNPELFLNQKKHLFLGIFQAIFTLGFLISSIINFQKRAKLISNVIKD
ncbi:hypothetical protein HYS97_00260 [Candidatus Daviesbacteria bacterium]|nr:hypothetical protein [Candidatus Daviesbacteria bacterium]